VLTVIPILIGALASGPMVARELEAGTFRLSWTQGCGRTRWLLARLGLLALAVTARAALVSVIFSWYYQRVSIFGVVVAAAAFLILLTVQLIGRGSRGAEIAGVVGLPIAVIAAVTSVIAAVAAVMALKTGHDGSRIDLPDAADRLADEVGVRLKNVLVTTVTSVRPSTCCASVQLHAPVRHAPCPCAAVGMLTP
jgi:hypothetical protein